MVGGPWEAVAFTAAAGEEEAVGEEEVGEVGEAEAEVVAGGFQLGVEVSVVVARAAVGNLMKVRDFVDQLHRDKIVAAIREAEKKTSGEIRVFITRKPTENPLEMAKQQFVKMGMEKTQERNGVLLFVAPRTHKFAIVGDVGVQTRCGDAFWTELAHEMSSHFKKADFTNGIIYGVHKAGELLAEHFPRKRGDKNELPDEVEGD
jgi:uncharacterized membrane protein